MPYNDRSDDSDKKHNRHSRDYSYDRRGDRDRSDDSDKKHNRHSRDYSYDRRGHDSGRHYHRSNNNNNIPPPPTVPATPPHSPTISMRNVPRPQKQQIPPHHHLSTIAFKVMNLFNQNTKSTFEAYNNGREYTSGGRYVEYIYDNMNKSRPDSEIAALTSIFGNDNPVANGVKNDSLLDRAIREARINKSELSDHLRVKIYLQNSNWPPCTPEGTQRGGMPCNEYIPSIIPRLKQQYPDTDFRIKVMDPKYTTRYGDYPNHKLGKKKTISDD